MKTAVVIAPHYAKRSAFSVYRGLEEGMRRAAALGYQGVELALADGEETDPHQIKSLLKTYHLELPAISTGRLLAERKLYLSAPDAAVREKAVAEFLKIMDFASETGSMVNIGRARGRAYSRHACFFYGQYEKNRTGGAAKRGGYPSGAC